MTPANGTAAVAAHQQAPGDRNPAVIPDLISVIIPTHRRYRELREAVASSLAQTYPQVEVLVVADGPDPAARDFLAGLLATHGERLRYLELPGNAGPAAARNFGVEHARGEFLTFLDDDDSMLPERLALQHAELDRDHPHILSACRMIYRHDGREDIWPHAPISPGQDVSEYLLCRPSLLGRPGILSLQSLVMHHSVPRTTPLSNHADHEDWAWLLEAWHRAGVRIRFLWQPLVTYNIETAAITRSRRTNWQDSLDWALHYRAWLTRPAFNSFLGSKVALKAKRAGSWRGLRQIFRILRQNHPSTLDLLFFFGIALIPNGLAHLAWKRSLRASATHTGITDAPATGPSLPSKARAAQRTASPASRSAHLEPHA